MGSWERGEASEPRVTCPPRRKGRTCDLMPPEGTGAPPPPRLSPRERPSSATSSHAARPPAGFGSPPLATRSGPPSCPHMHSHTAHTRPHIHTHQHVITLARHMDLHICPHTQTCPPRTYVHTHMNSHACLLSHAHRHTKHSYTCPHTHTHTYLRGLCQV